MWTGEKIIFYEKSVIGPYFKEMGLDTFQFASADYVFYATSTYQLSLLLVSKPAYC